VEAVFNKVGEAEVDNRERRVDRDGDLGDDGPSIEDRAFEARQAYEKQRKLCADFARSVEDVLRGCLEAADIKVHEITSREKDPDSFERKAAKRKIDNPDEPKYSDPLSQITDKAAIRIITYLPSSVDSVSIVSSVILPCGSITHTARGEPSSLPTRSDSPVAVVAPSFPSASIAPLFASHTTEV